MLFSHTHRPLAAGLAGASSFLAAHYARSRQDASLWPERPVACEEKFRPLAKNHIEAKFESMHKKGLVKVGDWHMVTLYPPMSPGAIWDTARYYMNIMKTPVGVKVWDAREEEASEGVSKKDFFQKHGFVLMNHETAMRADDWNASAPNPLGIANVTGLGMPKTETPLSRIYHKEVEQIIRYLIPEAKYIELDPLIVRRGPGTKNPGYNFAPHQDYGLTIEDWPLPTPEFSSRFERSDVKGFVVLNFWRPVLPMQGPVRKTPLAVCDPRSVHLEDLVPVNVKRDQMGHVKMMDLAHDEDQVWYYYPDMTVGEVLVFKSFQYLKSQTGLELNTCFHTAFENPDAPRGAEERQSCEYRARIWF